MDKAKRVSDTPYPVEVEEAKTYFWCACGLRAPLSSCQTT